MAQDHKMFFMFNSNENDVLLIDIHVYNTSGLTFLLLKNRDEHTICPINKY